MAELQVKALLLICLLAGHEAARVAHQDVAVMGGQMGTPSDDEEAFQTANDQCKWSILDRQCYSAENSNPQMCAWRSLPWDWSFSESCRLTDAYMTSAPNRARFFEIQAGVLSAKSKKVAENCKGSSMLGMTFNRKCQRRMKHMMRAMKFLSKAQDDELVKSLPPAQKAKEQALFTDAMTNMADAMGDDGPSILMLQQKMSANKAALKRDPQATVSNAIAILSKLLKGSEAEKAAARQEITDMPDHGETLSAEEEAELDAKNSQIAEGMRSEESETQTLIDDVDNLVPDNDTDTGSSLMEAGGLLTRSDRSDAIAFVLMVLLVIMTVVWVVTEIVFAIVSWALISILGCGLGVVSYNAFQKNVTDEVGMWGTTKCFARVFAFPFILTGRAVAGMYNWIWGHPNKQAFAQLSMLEHRVNSTIHRVNSSRHEGTIADGNPYDLPVCTSCSGSESQKCYWAMEMDCRCFHACFNDDGRPKVPSRIQSCVGNC